MTEQKIQYEKKLQRIIGMLKENPNQREEINKGIDRLIYLRGRLFEQSQHKYASAISGSNARDVEPSLESRYDSKDVDTPQDCSGQANVADKEETDVSALPADLNSISRLTVVYDGKRAFEKYNVKIEESLQDKGRTLKLFVKDRTLSS